MTPDRPCDCGKVRLSGHQEAETRDEAKECNGQQRDIQPNLKQLVHSVCNSSVVPQGAERS